MVEYLNSFMNGHIFMNMFDCINTSLTIMFNEATFREMLLSSLDRTLISPMMVEVSLET